MLENSKYPDTIKLRWEQHQSFQQTYDKKYCRKLKWHLSTTVSDSNTTESEMLTDRNNLQLICLHAMLRKPVYCSVTIDVMVSVQTLFLTTVIASFLAKILTLRFGKTTSKISYHFLRNLSLSWNGSWSSDLYRLGILHIIVLKLRSLSWVIF